MKWWDFGMLFNIMHRLRRPPNILAWNAISRCQMKVLWLVSLFSSVHSSRLNDHLHRIQFILRSLTVTNFAKRDFCFGLFGFRSIWDLLICIRMTLIWIFWAAIFHGSYQIPKFKRIGFMRNIFVSEILNCFQGKRCWYDFNLTTYGGLN